jgi:hypothetical protein
MMPRNIQRQIVTSLRIPERQAFPLASVGNRNTQSMERDLLDPWKRA